MLFPRFRRASDPMSWGIHHVLAWLMLLVLLLIAGCSADKISGDAKQAGSDRNDDQAANAMQNKKAVESTAMAEDSVIDQDSGQRFATSQQEPPRRNATAQRRMIIYDAWLRLATHNMSDVLDRAETEVKALGGYVQSSSKTQRVLRVPSEHYDAALTTLKGLGEVRSLRTESQDITEAFTNMAARIDNLRALEARLRELLAQATTLQERLAIETELRRIETERRALEERLAYLKDRALFATITLHVEPIDTQQATKPQRPQPFPFVRDFGLGPLMG